MHILARSGLVAPECLASYDHLAHTWNDVKECKPSIRARLVTLQGMPGVSDAEGAGEFGVRCAYCEGAIRAAGHIEHFRRKGIFPELTFEWSNLFLACGATGHCGHYKDRSAADPYSPNDLIKPDVHDPDDYLFFSSNGEVYPRAGIDARGRHVAEETIRVFNLNHGTLVGARRRAVESYVEEWAELLADQAASELAAILAEEIAKTEFDEYSTTIKHYLRV